VESPEIIASMDQEFFSQVMATSSRQVREILFSRFGIKAKKKIASFSSSNRLDRVEKLHEKLGAAKSKQEKEVCTELLRTWLFTKRPMLALALNFLGIENDKGLVEKDTDFFAKLKKDQVAKLVAHLKSEYPEREVLAYLAFVNVPHLDEII